MSYRKDSTDCKALSCGNLRLSDAVFIRSLEKKANFLLDRIWKLHIVGNVRKET
jgi:hypothetical protein